MKNKYIPVLLSVSDKITKNEMEFVMKREDAWAKWRRLHNTKNKEKYVMTKLVQRSSSNKIIIDDVLD